MLKRRRLRAKRLFFLKGLIIGVFPTITTSIACLVQNALTGTFFNQLVPFTLKFSASAVTLNFSASAEVARDNMSRSSVELM